MFTLQNLKKAIKKPRMALWYIRKNIAYKLWLEIPASQFGEDIILDYLIRKDKWFYVDIGASTPLWWNNTYLFYQKWRKGICIEPNKRQYKKIKKYRSKWINLNLAVGEKWKLTYYEIDADGMSTCNKKIADFYISKWHKITNTYTTEVKPLSEILDTYAKWKHIDIMSVDVEWMDMEVLQSNNRSKYKPDYIIVETIKYKSDNEPWTKEEEKYTKYLSVHWYKIIADTYINTIYRLQKKQ